MGSKIQRVKMTVIGRAFVLLISESEFYYYAISIGVFISARTYTNNVLFISICMYISMATTTRGQNHVPSSDNNCYCFLNKDTDDTSKEIYTPKR